MPEGVSGRAASPFALPRGMVGWLAGRVMARTNADMAEAAADLLRLRGRERVLEIGFGPGVGIAALARRLPEGYVCGVDPSRVMLRQAVARNRDGVRDGRIDLRLGTASSLPWIGDFFDAACAVNSVMLWDPLDEGMRELRRVLKPGGRLVVAVHAWAGRGRRGAQPRRLAEEVGASLAAAGLPALTLRQQRARSGTALYWS